VDFIFLASLQSHTTQTLEALSQALDQFHANKGVFVELEVRVPGHFNIPKIHSMEHYVELIGRFGSADGFNTESPERLHIDYAKNAYRASNKKDYTRQMTNWLRRQEAGSAGDRQELVQEIVCGAGPGDILPDAAESASATHGHKSSTRTSRNTRKCDYFGPRCLSFSGSFTTALICSNASQFFSQQSLTPVLPIARTSSVPRRQCNQVFELLQNLLI